jgi:RNA polymerase sigma-70 factor (ECF subfamily)
MGMLSLVRSVTDFLELSDGDLAQAVADGAGEPAETALVSRFRRRVFLYGMRHLRDEGRADDLSQEVMATTITRLRAGEVDNPLRIASFVLGMARWMTHDDRRRRRRAREVAEAAAAERDMVVEPREPVDGEALAAALAELPERERAVVVLSFQQERTAPQIGEALGLKAGHVRVIRHRAIARLARVMGVPDGEEEGTR